MARGKTLLAAALVMAAMGFSSLNKETLECEHAVAHLKDCCPSFELAAGESACDRTQGCATETDPVFSESVSACIQAQTCEALQQQEICQRAAAALPRVWYDDPSQKPADAGPPPEEVCP